MTPAKGTDLAFLPRGSIVLAPLSGYGDLPFRRIARRFGCAYAFAPMVDASAIAIGSGRSERIADRGEEEDWLGLQVVGRDPDRIARSCEKLAAMYRPDVLDLNLGCPAPKVRKKGQGAALLTKPEAVRDCVKAMVGATGVPVTIKMRIPPGGTLDPALAIVQAAADGGAAAAAVHARTPREGYSGPVRMEVLAEIVRLSPVPVIGNGGIYSRWLLEDMLDRASPYAVMVAGGVMGNPWLFASLLGRSPWAGSRPRDHVPDPAPPLAEFVEVIRSHVEETVRYYGEGSGFPRTRKLILKYLKGRGFPREIKVAVSGLSSQDGLDDISRMMESSPRAPLARTCGVASMEAP